MFKSNPAFSQLPKSYLFSKIADKVKAFEQSHPQTDVIRLGIGDVTLPLVPAVVAAMTHAADEMENSKTFRGYGPEQGYAFLREKIAELDYAAHGIAISPDEIFVSDGSKCDVANIQELFSPDTKIAITDPVYPVYRDSNILAGRGDKIHYMPCLESQNFVPEPPDCPVDVIYLCSPNNPTGTVMSRARLEAFVDYALRNQAIILFDCAYYAYIREAGLPRSIYEIPGAEKVAIEFRSYSKTAGFTGVRCAYTVVPKTLPEQLNAMWRRRQSTKFNGVSYVVQRAAEATYSEEGRQQIVSQVSYYMKNAQIISHNLQEMGYTIYGGENAPYIWLKLPEGVRSEVFFDELLANCAVVGTPGVGFGSCGEGFFRLTAFGNRAKTQEALERMRLWKIN